MKKEILVAIIFGFIIGFIIVFGVVTAQKALEKHQGPSNQSAENPTSSPTPSPVAAVGVTISDPEDGAVVGSDKITLHGTTAPKSTVVITTEKTDIIAPVEESGIFSQEVTLVSGANEIQVISFSPSGDRSETTVTVVLSTADF